MTVVALAIILFESGTKLKLSSLGRSLPSTLLITFVTVFVTIGLLALGSWPFLEKNWSLALITGTILCGTSSAVVIPMVESLKMGEKAKTILVLESALTDVVCIVLTFALVEGLSTGDVSLFGVSTQVMKSLAFAAVVGVVGGVFWLMVWEKVREIPSSVFTTIAFAFVLYGIAELLGLSGAIATLSFGISLANLPLVFKTASWVSITERESDFYQEIVFLLKTFFFIFLGISIQISDLTIVVVALLLIALLYFIRLWISRYSLSNQDVSQRDAIVASVMIPKGLAPAVLVGLIMQKGISNAETIQAFVYSVVVLSIVVTAVLVPLTQKGVVSRFYKLVLHRFSDQSES